VNNLLLVSSITFPYGMADTSRIRELCFGFTQNGIKLDLLVHRKNKNDISQYDFNVYSVETSALEVKKRNIASLVVSRTRFLLLFLRLYFNNEYKYVYFYHPNFDNFVCLLIARLFSKKIFIIEYTDILEKPKDFSVSYLLQRFSYIIFPKLVNRVVVISSRLKRYFELFYNVPVSSIVALSPSSLISHRVDNKFQYNRKIKDRKSGLSLTFAGSLIASEGVDDLIDSFVLLSNQYHDILLNIAGFSLVRSPIEIKDKIVKSGKFPLIKFHGYLSGDDVTFMLNNSDILVLPKLNVKYNRFGFSTKIAEYVMFGKVIVCSDISDFRLHLSRFENVIFYNPDDDFALLNALAYAVRNFDRLKLFAQENEYELKTVFDSRTLTKDFCQCLLKIQ
jgi:glycosyltransferase involved in cell wall biosynthesis